MSDIITPDWPAPARVQALCTTRSGGVSLPPFDCLNLGPHVGDDPLAVATNRALLAKHLGAKPVFLTQVHGSHVQGLEADTLDGAQADACITTQRGLVCTIMVADCLPVLLTDEAGSFVAAVHAGWRGLAGQDGHGVLESVTASIMALTAENTKADSAPASSKIVAWLGPCIGPTAFEVGPEVKAAFTAQDSQAQSCFRPNVEGKWLADLQGLARQRLRALGVTQVYGNDGSAPWCTVNNPSRFFSHRRDGISGRMAACIWLA